MTDKEHIDAIEYVADNVLSMFGMRVLLQATWDAAQKMQRGQFKARVGSLIESCGTTGQSKAHSVAYRRVLEALEPDATKGD